MVNMPAGTVEVVVLNFLKLGKFCDREQLEGSTDILQGTC